MEEDVLVQTEIKRDEEFYKNALQLLIQETEYPFLLGGGFALRHYLEIDKDMKDLDLFCYPADHFRILKFFDQKGYQTEYTDSRWLGKVFKNENYIDLICSSVNNVCKVEDFWFEYAHKTEILGIPVSLVAPEEVIWCKLYVQNRERFDGADINHLILKWGNKLDWERIYKRMDLHWHLLLSALVNFQFVYPSERDIIPRWVFDSLLQKAQEQFDLPHSVEKVCRGPLIDNTQYKIDVIDWEFKALTIKTV